MSFQTFMTTDRFRLKLLKGERLIQDGVLCSFSSLGTVTLHFSSVLLPRLPDTLFLRLSSQCKNSVKKQFTSTQNNLANYIFVTVDVFFSCPDPVLYFIRYERTLSLFSYFLFCPVQRVCIIVFPNGHETRISFNNVHHPFFLCR